MSEKKVLTALTIKIIVSFLIVICFAGDGFSKTGKWVSVPLRTSEQKEAGLASAEGFQYVHAIAYAPSKPSVVYMSTDTSQVWKSTNSGTSWKPVNRGFISHGARSLLVDPANSEIVFAAGFLGKSYEDAKNSTQKLQGIYRTTDGGKNWMMVKKTDFYKQESKGCLFAFDSFSMEASKTKVVFAGSYNDGLLRSSDYGDTWQSAAFKDSHIIDMKENIARPGELFVATEDALYTYYKGLVKKIGGGLPDWPKSVAISNHKPNILYTAVGKHGVYKSSDGGRSFYNIGSGLPLHVYFTDIAVSPVNSEILYLKAHQSVKRPFFSFDGAKNWTAAQSLDAGNLLGDTGGFWFSAPFVPHPKEPMIALTASNGKARIFRTSDGGRNWRFSGEGFTGGRMRDIAFSADGKKMTFCLTDHGLWTTKDQCDTFQQLPVKQLLGATSSRSGAVRESTIVASLGTWSDKGLAVSQDFGTSWKHFDKLIDRYHFIASHPKKTSLFYAGPYRTEDKGVTWTKMPRTVRWMYHGNGDIVYAVSSENSSEASSSINTISSHSTRKNMPSDSINLRIKEIHGAKSPSTLKCLVLKSYDQGDSWHRPYQICNFGVSSVQDMTVAPDDPDRLYVATSNGLWTYDGKSWLLITHAEGISNDYFGKCHISSVAVDPNQPKHIYVGKLAPKYGQSNGVFRSTDRGITWQNITYNLGPELSVWSVRISPADGTVYIGTSLGTWKYVE